MDVGGQLRQEGVDFLRPHRFLDEHQLERLKLFQQHLRHRLVHPAMEIHGDVDVRPDG